MKSIRHQLVVIVILITVVICGALGFVSYQSSQSAVIHQVDEALEQLALAGTHLIESEIENQLLYLETVSMHGVISGDSPVQQQTGFLKMAAERMNFIALGIADQHGNATRSDGLEVNIADRAFFQNAINGTSNVSDVLVSKSTGEAIITYAVPIQKNGQITSVLYGVREASELTNMTKNITFGGQGYAFIIGADGTMLAHPNTELVYDMVNYIEEAKEDNSLEDLSRIMERQMIQGETGVGRYYYDGMNKIAGFAPIPGTNWSLAVSASLDDALHDVIPLRNRILLLTGGLILIGIIAAFFISSWFANPIINLTNILDRFANYDLTLEDKSKVTRFRNRKDEIGRVAIAIEKMQSAFVGLLRQAVESSEIVGATSEQLSASIQQISSNAQNQASTTEELSSSMEEMTAGIHIVNDNMHAAAEDVDVINHTMAEVEIVITDNNRNLEDINHSISTILKSLEGTRASINTISDKSRSASEEADGTVALAKEGRENLDRTVNQMNSIQNTIQDLSQVINDLGESANQIGDITNLIKDVAEQTNLLALNASIEAARAGEHGKGFAVVAQAIGNLAEESQNATKEIARVIKDIQSQIHKAVENSREGTQVVESGTHLIQETSGSLDNIFGAIQLTSDVIGEITSLMDVQSKDTNEIYSAAGDINDKVNNLMAAMEEEMASSAEIKNSLDSITSLINDISESMEQQSAASEQVSSAMNDNAAGIEEISAGGEEIARSAEELARSAQELIQHVRRFQL